MWKVSVFLEPFVTRTHDGGITGRSSYVTMAMVHVGVLYNYNVCRIIDHVMMICNALMFSVITTNLDALAIIIIIILFILVPYFSFSLQTSCIVRVPFEVIKQRAQANRHLRPMQILRHTLQTEVNWSPWQHITRPHQ